MITNRDGRSVETGATVLGKLAETSEEGGRATPRLGCGSCGEKAPARAVRNS